MQGEGQEFESPRLHHWEPTRRTEHCLQRTGNELNIGARRPAKLETRSLWETAARHNRAVVWCLDRDPAKAGYIAPLIREPVSSPTSGSLGTNRTSPRRTGGSLRAARPNLNNWIVFRQIEDLQFRRVVQGASRAPSETFGFALRGTFGFSRSEAASSLSEKANSSGVTGRLDSGGPNLLARTYGN